MNKSCEFDSLLCRICYHGAPTISRVKPASLICFRNNDSFKMKDLWCKYKDTIKNIIPFSFYEVMKCDDGVNVLFYHEDWIKRILSSSKNRDFLKDFGYSEYDFIEDVFKILHNNFEKGCPHEIGLFLGYPLSDVRAFISDGKGQCLKTGYWKVYSNLTRANRIFALYDKKRIEVVSSLERGMCPVQLLEQYI